MLFKGELEKFMQEACSDEACSLDCLCRGEKAKIMNIDSQELELALLKIGVMKGDQVSMADKAPFGGPLAFQVNGTKISLRKKDASHVWIVKG